MSSIAERIAKMFANDEARLTRIDQELDAARADADAKYAALGQAVLDDGADASKSAKARRDYDAAQERVSQLEAAADLLRKQVDRARSAEEARIDEEQKRQRERETNETFDELLTSARAVDDAIDALVAAVKRNVAVQEKARALVDTAEMSTQLASANMALRACLGRRLQFMPGMTSGILDESRTRWTRYMPGRDFADRKREGGAA